jgi:hypothetical protein
LLISLWEKCPLQGQPCNLKAQRWSSPQKDKREGRSEKKESRYLDDDWKEFTT